MATPPPAEAPAPRAVAPGRPAGRYGCGCLIVILVALLVGCGVVFQQWRATGSHPLQPEARAPITGSAALLSDGVTIVYTDPAGLCRQEDLAATQTPARVTLALSERVDLAQGGCPGFPHPLGSADPPGQIIAMQDNFSSGYPVVTQLAAPLGHRRLVDAVTGRVIPCFDQRGALRLPRTAGWARFDDPGDLTTSVPFFGGPGAAVLAQRFTGYDRTSQLDGRTLMIVQVAGGGWHPPTTTVTRKVVVRGHQGLAAAGIIVWQEAGRVIAVIGQGPLPGPPGQPGQQARPGRAPLPLAGLLAVAAALTRG